jgi:hypothetical protein
MTTNNTEQFLMKVQKLFFGAAMQAIDFVVDGHFNLCLELTNDKKESKTW